MDTAPQRRTCCCCCCWFARYRQEIGFAVSTVCDHGATRRRRSVQQRRRTVDSSSKGGGGLLGGLLDRESLEDARRGISAACTFPSPLPSSRPCGISPRVHYRRCSTVRERVDRAAARARAKPLPDKRKTCTGCQRGRQRRERRDRNSRERHCRRDLGDVTRGVRIPRETEREDQKPRDLSESESEEERRRETKEHTLVIGIHAITTKKIDREDCRRRPNKCPYGSGLPLLVVVTTVTDRVASSSSW